MRIIKPYGRSHVSRLTDVNDSPRRTLRLTKSPEISVEIEKFAHTHDVLVIAHWVSIIDKIATKPKNAKGPTAAQQNLRAVLGDAAWTHLLAHGLLPTAINDADKAGLHLIWQSKIAPWGNASLKPEDKYGRPSPKGRWYDRFAGEIHPAAITPDHAGQIASEIHDHLYRAAKRKYPEAPNRRQGLIKDRARSIAGNVLKPGDHAAYGWNMDDREKYARSGDVAGKIYAAACREIKARKKPASYNAPSTQNLPRDLAAKVLYEQYGKVFGKDTCIKAALAQNPGIFALHAAIKDCYQRFLHDYHKQDILRILPRDMTALFHLIEAQHRNRDVNALIRLGKVIHYHVSENAPGTQQDVINNWPEKAAIETSRFWGSDGQADIKRHEAFVRVWCHVIALASRTLHDWADAKGTIKADIFSEPARKQAIGKKTFDSNHYQEKCNVLFGAHAGVFCGDLTFEKSVLEQAIMRSASLRHATFHFKGKDRFLHEMHNLAANDMPTGIMEAIAKLWHDDGAKRDEQVIETLKAVYADQFLNMAQNRHIFETLTSRDARSGLVPLPRLRRVLLRHDNISQGRRLLSLPACPKRDELEKHPSLLCQYSILKMLYDGPFRYWLEQRSSDDLNYYIDRATERSSKAALTINGRKVPDAEQALITARASKLPRLNAGEKIASFLSRLAAATATEMRVQRGYDSNADAARKQAEFIGELECDVMALALVDFIKNNNFAHILDLDRRTDKPEKPLCDLTRLRNLPRRPAPSVEAWQQVLYFILHLVPVDEAGRLLHQIRKWQILETGATGIADDLQAVLSLYLEMHDAKFTGGAALHGIEKFAGFFEHPADFRTVFPAQTLYDRDRSIPRRGLREIMRFGHFPLLKRLAGDVQVTHAQVDAWQKARSDDGTGSSPIAKLQKQREELHEKAVKKPKSFRDEDVRHYMHSLAEVIRQRHQATHVTLADQVRVHRLMMGVLGRLADYARLWERDLYFVLLALIYHHKLTPEKVLTPDNPGVPGQKDEQGGLSFLQDGRIVEALRKIREDAPDLFKNDLKHVCPCDDHRIDIRNMLLHFNMLRNAQSPDLTECMNQTRSLMNYDRKLKNAVSKSVREMLAREGLKIEWQMDSSKGEHKLHCAALYPEQAIHFQNGKIKVCYTSRDQKKGGKFTIMENVHSPHLVERAALLFNGKAKKRSDITARTGFDDLCLDTEKRADRKR
tara:strand:- start:72308 stop:75919 length:3612 start_codon:yes stop_codon:yes gene_type:complete